MRELLPKTRRLIVFFIGIIAVATLFGWMYKALPTEDVLIVVLLCLNGFFTLLKGEQ